MNPKITLTRNLRTSRWTFVGEVSFSEKRTWELSVLRLADERKYVDASTVNEDLLGGVRLSVAERLLDIMKGFRLLDQNGGLTEEGRRALSSGEIFVPQRGAWTVLIAEGEPLLGAPLLSISPANEPSAFDEVGAPKGWRQPPPQLSQLPDELRQIEGDELVPALDGSRCVRIESFGEQQTGRRELVTEEHRISLRYDETGHPMVAIGDKSIQSQCRVDREAVWEGLLRGEGLLHAWNAGKSAMAVGFDGLTDPERRDRVRSLHFAAPEISGLGKFEPLKVDGVALTPASPEDAQKWAEWRLMNNIGDFAAEHRFQSWWEEARKPFSEFALRQPDRAALVAALRPIASNKPDARYWRLQAALDFAL